MAGAAMEHRRAVPREFLILAGVAVLAGLVRWWRWAHTDVIFADGPRFLSIAKAVAAGDWNTVMGDDFHPLYPIAAAAAHVLVPDWETAAVMVSIAGGVLAVVGLFALTRAAFGPSVGLIAAALLALHPRAVDFTSDVQSEGLYLGLFMVSLWCGWRAISGRSSRWACAAGVCAGFAYLARPEGIGVVGVLIVLALVEVVWNGWRPGRAIGWVAALVAGVTLTAAPYVWALHQETGTFTLTRKKSIAVVLGVRDPSSLPRLRPAPSAPLPALRDSERAEKPVEPAGGLETLWQFGRKGLKAFRYESLLLLMVGLWSSRGRPGSRGRFFGAVVGAYGIVLLGLLMSAGYVSRRHWLPVLVPLLGYAAVGVPVLGNWALGWVGRLFAASAPSRLVATLAGMMFLAVPAAFEFSEPRASRHLAERHAGEFAAASPEPRVVATRRSYAAYYAQGRHLPIEPSLNTLDPERLRARGATHVILESEALDEARWETVLAQPGVTLVERFEAHGREALLLEVDSAGRREVR